MGHIGQEGTLHLTGVFCTFGLFFQLLLGIHQVSDITGDSEIADSLTL